LERASTLNRVERLMQGEEYFIMVNVKTSSAGNVRNKRTDFGKGFQNRATVMGPLEGNGEKSRD